MKNVIYCNIHLLHITDKTVTADVTTQTDFIEKEGFRKILWTTEKLKGENLELINVVLCVVFCDQ